MISEAQKRAAAKYDREKTKQYKFKMNMNTDADVLAKLDTVPNKQGYIKQLIRADIARRGAENAKR